MTHSVVIVCLDPSGEMTIEEQLNQALEPFNENREVEPYREYEEGAPSENWIVRQHRSSALLPSNDTDITWEHVAKLSKRHYPEDPNRIQVDESGKGYQMSTYPKDEYNEDGQVIAGARWDWWLIGGRWTGYFKIKKQFSDDPRVIHGSPGTMTQRNEDPLKADGAPKSMIDMERMRLDAGEAAVKEWDEFRRLVGNYIFTTHSWEYFLSRVQNTEDPYTIEDARRDYNSQSGVELVRKSETDFRWENDPFAKYSVPRDVFANEAIRNAIAGWAVLTTDGEWREKGHMGWWATNDATDESRETFIDWANKYFDSLSDDTYLIAVDVHI